MSATILLIGAGNMGYAMLAGWLAQDPSLRVHVVEPFAAFRDRATALGAQSVADSADLPEGIRPDLVVLAVKPQMVGQVLRACSRFQVATFVSVAAGITIAAMQGAIAAPIIRCMPNTPAAIGEGMMVLCAATDVPQAARVLTERLMASSGAVAWLEDETLMDAVTAISGIPALPELTWKPPRTKTLARSAPCTLKSSTLKNSTSTDSKSGMCARATFACLD